MREPLWSFALNSTDVGEAEDSLRQIGVPARIVTVDPAFRFDLANRGDEEISFASFSLDGHWSATADLDVYVVAVAVTGALQWACNGAEGLIAADPVVLPVGRSVLDVDGAPRVFAVHFSTPALLRFARAFYDMEYVHLEVEPGAARTPAHGALWLSMLEYTRALARSAVIADPRLLSSLKVNLATALLNSFHVSGPRRAWRLSDAVGRTAFQRAVDFIEAGANRSITVLDVAGAAAVPLDLLNAAFREQTGQSVEGYLAMARIIGAHADLVRSRHDAAHLAAIAERWGFRSTNHLLRAHARLYPGGEPALPATERGIPRPSDF